MKKYLLLVIIIGIVLAAGCGGNGDTETVSPDGTLVPSLTTSPPPGPAPVFPIPSPGINMPGTEALKENTWVLAAVSDSSEEWQFSREAQIELQFITQRDRQFIKGYAGCNTYTADFHIEENTLFIDKLTYTERACQNQEIMDQEDHYLSALYEAHSFHFMDNGESLVIAYGIAIPGQMVFEPKPAPSPQPEPSPEPTKPPTPSPSPVAPPTPQVRPGTVMVSLYLDVQQSGTETKGCKPFPVNIGFYPPGSRPQILMNPDLALFYFTGTSSCINTVEGIRAMVNVGPVNPGTYDITADSPTTLLNVKRNVHIE